MVGGRDVFRGRERETGRKVRDGAAGAGEDAVEGLERIARPRMVGIRRWEESKGRTLVPSWW